MPVLIVVLWWWLSADSTSLYFPPLSTIATTFADTWDFAGLSDVLVPTLVTFFAGYGSRSCSASRSASRWQLTVGLPIS